MPRSTRDLLIGLAWGLVAIGSPAPAAAAAWEFPAALAGQVAPDTGGGTYASFGFVDVTSLGEVVFSATLSGGTAPAGLFSVAHRVAHGSRAIALVGDVVPGDPYPFPVTIAEFEGATTSGRRVAFLATFAPEGAGIFAADLDADTLTLIAKVGGAAPSGGVFQELRVPSNHCGDVVFAAATALQRGIFRSAGGTLSAVVLEGDPAPDYGDATFESFGDPNCSDNRVGFSAEMVFPSSPGFSLSGIFRHAGGPELVAVEEELAPDGVPYAAFSSESLGASFQRFAYTDGTGLFLSHEPVLSASVVMARLGQPAPRTGGGVFAAFPHSPVAKSGDFGTMLVALAQVSGGSAPSGVFEMFRTYTGVLFVSAPAIVGDPAPGTGGGTYSSFSRAAGANAFNPYIGEDGVIAFAAGVSGGTTTSGVFVLPEPGAPGGRLMGAALLILLRLRSPTARRSPRYPRS